MLLDSVDFYRLDASRKIDAERRSDLGQFMTPPATARLMASMFEAKHQSIKLLDAGAGVGSLTAAFIDEICGRKNKPKNIHVTAYEIDHSLAGYLSDALRQCQETCESASIKFESDLIERDFIEDGVRMLRQQMFAPTRSLQLRHPEPPLQENK